MFLVVWVWDILGQKWKEQIGVSSKNNEVTDKLINNEWFLSIEVISSNPQKYFQDARGMAGFWLDADPQAERVAGRVPEEAVTQTSLWLTQ